MKIFPGDVDNVMFMPMSQLTIFDCLRFVLYIVTLYYLICFVVSFLIAMFYQGD